MSERKYAFDFGYFRGQFTHWIKTGTSKLRCSLIRNQIGQEKFERIKLITTNIVFIFMKEKQTKKKQLSKK